MSILESTATKFLAVDFWIGSATVLLLISELATTKFFWLLIQCSFHYRFLTHFSLPMSESTATQFRCQFLNRQRHSLIKRIILVIMSLLCFANFRLSSTWLCIFMNRLSIRVVFVLFVGWFDPWVGSSYLGWKWFPWFCGWYFYCGLCSSFLFFGGCQCPFAAGDDLSLVGLQCWLDGVRPSVVACDVFSVGVQDGCLYRGSAPIGCRDSWWFLFYFLPCVRLGTVTLIWFLI